jgi:hypothetical protein
MDNEIMICIWKLMFTSDLTESMSFWLLHSLAIPRTRHFPHGRSPSHLCKLLCTYGNYHLPRGRHFPHGRSPLHLCKLFFKCGTNCLPRSRHFPHGQSLSHLCKLHLQIMMHMEIIFAHGSAPNSPHGLSPSHLCMHACMCVYTLM